MASVATKGWQSSMDLRMHLMMEGTHDGEVRKGSAQSMCFASAEAAYPEPQRSCAMGAASSICVPVGTGQRGGLVATVCRRC